MSPIYSASRTAQSPHSAKADRFRFSAYVDAAPSPAQTSHFCSFFFYNYRANIASTVSASPWVKPCGTPLPNKGIIAASLPVPAEDGSGFPSPF